MIGVFDIGNSYTKFVIFDKNSKIIGDKKFSTNELPLKDISKLLVDKKIQKVIIGSVVLNKENKIFDIAQSLGIEATIVSKELFWNKNFKCKCSKKEIGLDILASAYYLSRTQKEFLVISFGTLTFACIYYDDCIQGVSIAPNLKLNDYAVFTDVSLINDIKVKLNSDIKFGINTNTAISSGIVHYYQGFINSLYDAASSKININEIFLTGGNCHILKKIRLNFKITIDDYLVSRGYYEIGHF